MTGLSVGDSHSRNRYTFLPNPLFYSEVSRIENSVKMGVYLTISA